MSPELTSRSNPPTAAPGRPGAIDGAEATITSGGPGTWRDRAFASWWRYPTLLVVLIAVYYVALPSTAARLLASGLAISAGSALFIVGVHRYRPRRRRVWYLLAGSVALSGVADLVHGLSIWPDAPDRLPPLASLCYLVAYGLQVAAIAGMTSARWGRRSYMDLIDGLVVAVAVAMTSWELLISPHTAAVGIEADAGALTLLFPTLSVTVVWMVWRFVTQPRPGPFAGRVVLVALTLMGIGTIAAMSISKGLTDDPSLWFLGLFPFAILLLCSAALHPSMRDVTEPVDAPRHHHVWSRIAMLAVASAVGIVVLVEAARNGDAAAVGGGALLVLLVVVRLAMVLHMMDDELRQRVRLETRYRSVLESLEEGVLVQDSRGLIVDANPAAARITGASLDELTSLGQAPKWKAISPEGEPMRADRRPGLTALTTGQAQTGIELGLVRSDGEVRWVELNATPMSMSTGEPEPMVVSSFRDITERIRLAEVAEQSRRQLARAELDAQEEALKRATAEQSSRAKNEFLSRMSHELRTPLNAVLGFGQILSMADLPDGNGEHVDSIILAGQHLLLLIDEVLDIARIESGQFATRIEPVALDDALHQAVRLIRPLADDQGITVVVPPQPSGLVASADRRRLQRVMLNLLSNAVNYTPRGGTVHVQSRSTGCDRVEISVHDDGPGIPADELERIFEPFERLAPTASDTDGTGVGLTVVRAVVGSMRGTVTAESTPGNGSTFRVVLPKAPSHAVAPKPAPTIGRPVEPNQRHDVLYIEDNHTNRVLMQHVLRARPMVDLQLANDGSSGLDCALTRPPRLVLLDVHLPDVDGTEVLRRLRSDPRTRSIPVVAVTAAADEETVEKLARLGVDETVIKPFDVAKLLAVIDRFTAASDDDPESVEDAVGDRLVQWDRS